MSKLNIRRIVDQRRSWASCDAELIARTRELIATTNTILQQPKPTTFLGHGPRARPKPEPDQATGLNSDTTHRTHLK